jgi:mannan endo-1,4-beta-mannosidase
MSSWIGKRPGVILYTTYWCSPGIPYLFDIRLPNIWNNKSIPLITWTLQGCDGSGKPGIVKLVNNNTFDAYINEMGDHLKKWLSGNDGIYGNDDDRRLYLRFGRKFKLKIGTLILNYGEKTNILDKK